MRPLPKGVCLTVMAAMVAWGPRLESQTAPQPVHQVQPAAETSSQLEARAREVEAAGRTQEAFDLYVRALQVLPNDARDFMLRERIMTLSLKLDSPPPVPAAVERHFVRAQTMVEAARNEDDLDAAVAELQQALRAAPWVPALAYNLALVREKQQYYGAADENLKVYLLSKPEDAEEVRRKMYALEAKVERDKLARSREACVLESRHDDRLACAALIAAAEPMGYVAEYGAYDFACQKRQRFCGSLAAQTLRAAAAERFPNNVLPEVARNAQALRTAGIEVDTDRVPDLIVTSCRKEPESCAIYLMGVVRIAEVEKGAATEARDAEGLPVTGNTTTDGLVAIASLFRRGPRTPWADGFFQRIGAKLSCSPRQPADCLAAGYMAADGLGRKEDKAAAKTLFESGCNGGVTAACDAFARAAGASKPNVWATNIFGLQVDLRVTGDTALANLTGEPSFDGIRAVLHKGPKAFVGSYKAPCGVTGTIELRQLSNGWQGTITRIDCSVSPPAQVRIALVLLRK